MTVASEVVTAANAILAGDTSRRAAGALEAALHTYHPYDEDFEELLEVLALYSPGMEVPYTDHGQLCNAIRESPVSSETGGA